MEVEDSRARKKRPLSDDDNSDKPPMQKKLRFPKGKKVKVGDEVASVIRPEEGPSDSKDARFAAKERSKRRSQMTIELFEEEGTGIPHDISVAEVKYEDNVNFVDDGIQIEPFNLNQEREEGYFDADGNFVEFAIDKNEIKDAWLDSIDIDSRFAEKSSITTNSEEQAPDLSSEEIGKIKRRITDLLEPEETVLGALRRLKGTSNDKKGKMPEKTKFMFDQLTEDSMKLMDNGDYNVYHDKREVFQREAEGYERLARAREGISNSIDPSGDSAENFDMFADDDENAASDPTSDKNGLGLGGFAHSFPQSESSNADPDSAELQTDYVYDESSGYYYSSSLGYYYDSTSGLYCCATSGRWYSFNDQTGAYDEIQGDATSL